MAHRKYQNCMTKAGKQAVTGTLRAFLLASSNRRQSLHCSQLGKKLKHTFINYGDKVT